MQYWIWVHQTPLGTSQSILAKTSDGKMIGIPNDELNADYRTYLAWVAEGNTAEEWQPEQVIEDAN